MLAIMVVLVVVMVLTMYCCFLHVILVDTKIPMDTLLPVAISALLGCIIHLRLRAVTLVHLECIKHRILLVETIFRSLSSSAGCRSTSKWFIAEHGLDAGRHAAGLRGCQRCSGLCQCRRETCGIFKI